MSCVIAPLGGFGAGPLGAIPWGAAYAVALAILEAAPYRRNSILVAAQASSLGSRYEAGSLRDPDVWSLLPLDPDAVGRLVQSVEPYDGPLPFDPGSAPFVVEVYLDGPLTERRAYRLQLDTTLSGACRQRDFVSLGTARTAFPDDPRTQTGALRDIANPQLLADGSPAVGTYVITDGGDLALERSAETSLRKRVIRRLTTGVAGIFHLPDYGVVRDLGSLLTPDRIRRYQARARAQILQEPDVSDAVVRASVLSTAPSVLSVRVEVVASDGSTVGVTAPIEL